jgi:nitrite reductase/ring-hydroxylating ferredoxin subunit
MKFYLAVIALALVAGCKKEKPQYPVPDVAVDIQVQINSPAHPGLILYGGHAYAEGGYKGIIIYHDYNDMFFAMDRACTYHPHTDCARVTMDTTGISIKCGKFENDEFNACCASRYFTTGEVMEGPAQYPLKHYRVQRVGNILYIRN